MFLKHLIRSNPELIEYAKQLHKDGEIRPDTYVLDVDTILANATNMLSCARTEGIELLFMLKQLGRNPYLAKKLIDIGYTGAVVVDYKEAEIMMDHHIPLGNVGHLVQIPIHMLKKIIASKPQQITVYSMSKIQQIQQVAQALDIPVSITLKVFKDSDQIYKSQEGGFTLHQLESIYEQVKDMSHVHIEGVTAFPCFLYDEVKQRINATANAATVIAAKNILEQLGCDIKHVNLPSATCLASIPLIKQLGGTQGEPGHALSGTTPFHVDHDTYEKPAYVYVSEISHLVGSKSYAFGGGYYRRGHMHEVLIRDEISSVLPMEDSAIDYHIEIDNANVQVGDCAILCFRTQMFVTRSDIVLVEGLSKHTPHIVGVYDSQGRVV